VEEVEAEEAQPAEAEEAQPAEADEAQPDTDTDDAATDEAEAADSDGALTGAIPEDFPQASRLESAGITTFEELLDVEELTDISGIGPTYAEQIQEALAERNASS